MGSGSVPDLEQVGYRVWKKACVGLAQSLNTAACSAGALGFLLPETEYCALTGVSAFVPLTRPDPEDGTYKTKKREFDREQEAKATLRQGIFASVPAPVLERIPGYDPEYGILRLDLRVLWEALRERAAFASHTLYEKALAALAVPYMLGTSMEGYISSHTALHRECTSIGFALNQGDKLRFFIGGIGGYEGPFSTTLAVWEERLGQEPQRRTFEDGGAQIPLPPLLQDEGKPRQGRSRASASVPDPHVAEYEGLATIVRRAAMRFPPTAVATAATFGTRVQEPQQPPLMAAVTHVAKKPDQWCWSHGKGSHAGSECRNRAKGHRPEATATHPMGGPAPRTSR